jgi:hypothetical protein
VTPPPSVATSPSAVAVEVPLAARAETPQGAAAFARFYLAEVDKAAASGDTTVLRRLSSASCQTCRNVATAIERDRAQGLRLLGGARTVTTAEASVEATFHLVDISYDTAASRVVDDGDQTVRSSPARRGGLMQMAVVHVDEWIVRAIRFPKVPE